MPLTPAQIINYYYSGGGAPALSSSLIAQGTPTILQLTFNGTAVITTSGWSIATDGPNALSISSVSDSGTSTPSFTLSREILPGEVITLSYTGGTTTVNGNDLGDITDRAVTNNVLYWAEDFTGTVIDTARFNVTNPNSADLLITQNNELRFTRVTDNAVAGALTNNVETDLIFPLGVYSVLMDLVTGFATSVPVFRWVVDASNFISLQGTGLAIDAIRAAIQVGGGGLDYDVTSTQNKDGTRIRWIVTATTITFQYWDGDSWELIPLTSAQTLTVGTGGKIMMASSSAELDAAGDRLAWRQLRYAPTAWNTELPEDFFFLNDWILDGGVWNDINVWNDTKNWID